MNTKAKYLTAKAAYDKASKQANTEMDTPEFNAMLDAGKENEVATAWEAIMIKHNLNALREALRTAEKSFLAESKQNILGAAMQAGKSQDEIKLVSDTFDKYEKNVLFVSHKEEFINALLA